MTAIAWAIAYAATLAAYLFDTDPSVSWVPVVLMSFIGMCVMTVWEVSQCKS